MPENNPNTEVNEEKKQLTAEVAATAADTASDTASDTAALPHDKAATDKRAAVKEAVFKYVAMALLIGSFIYFTVYGFLSNPSDEALAMSASHRQKFAKAVAQGVVNYYSAYR